jgi:hypothetical protein
MSIVFTLPSPRSEERRRRLTAANRVETELERLYERRAAVQDLIESLERYDRTNQGNYSGTVDFTELSVAQ